MFVIAQTAGLLAVVFFIRSTWEL